MAYLYNLVGIFIVGTYLAIKGEAEVALSYVLVCLCSNAGYICI